MDAQELKTILSHGTPKVVVVGGGYVGLPFAVVAAHAR
jgi:UDP-N-acetyl-D-mannosaminuronate dehydrogenase